MATPSTLSYGTVVGQFLVSASDSVDADALPDAVPASGTVTFTPSAGVVLDYADNPNPTAILRKPIVSTLDSSGYITAADGTRGIKLIATDNATVKPIDWTWVATYALTDPEGNPLRTLTTQPFLVPSGVTTDLIEAMPLSATNGVFITKGDKGDLTTLEIGTVTVGDPAVSVTEVGPVSELSFVLPVSNLSIGAVTTGPGTPGIVGPTGATGATGAKGDPGGIVLGTLLGTNDLNTIVTSGVYRQTNSSGADSPLSKNYPYNGGYGTLVVYETTGSADITQEFRGQSYAAGMDARLFYRRNRSNGVWSPWRAFNSTRVDQTAGRAIYQWDDLNNREQIVYGDTGVRDVSATILNANWTLVNSPNGTITLRRYGNMVTLQVQRLTRTSSGISVGTLPLGFRPDYLSRGVAATLEATPVVHSFRILTSGAWEFEGSVPSGVGVNFTHTFMTYDAWPTTLPGTAVGTIPNL